MALKPGRTKLIELRELIKNIFIQEQRGIQAYIVTSDDTHQCEDIRKQDKRREYISGFKGSAGTAVITEKNALLWTDGRYFSQASMELDPIDEWTLMKEGVVGTPTIENWLIDNLPSNSRIGADPNLICYSTWNRWQSNLNAAGYHLIPIEDNLIDKVWGNERPIDHLNKIVPHSIEHTGKIAQEKVQHCFECMEKNQVTTLVLTALDEIAYLLNWRGSDIPYNPVFISYVILYSKQVHIFLEENRLTKEAKQQLKDEKVDFVIHPYEEVRTFLKKISNPNDNSKMWISSSSSYALHADSSSMPIHTAVTPVCLMKLVKNETEIKGMKSAHIKDAIAIVKYFAWLEETLTNDISVVTEVSGAEQLEKFRQEQENYAGPSFPTISASGKHGSIIHYRPSLETDIPITCNDLYLCDTGAQFPGGTTDVTRTLHFGQPTEFERECFTRVFKGQSTLAMAKFPAMIKGNYLDTLARKNLWDVGLDYLHGTGHGVGAYLNVHEYPAMISWRPYPDDPGLQTGMFLSNEPGYYEDGKFGIRLENVEMIVKADTKYKRLNRDFLTFETVTLVPIQTKMLNISMLTDIEIQYLNEYHEKCYKTLEPYLSGPDNINALKWLKKETQRLER